MGELSLVSSMRLVKKSAVNVFCSSASPLYFSFDRMERTVEVDHWFYREESKMPRCCSSLRSSVMDKPDKNNRYIRRTLVPGFSSMTRLPFRAFLVSEQ